MTISEVVESERRARDQRIANGRHLIVVESGASGDDLVLARRVKAAAIGDGAAFDAALADRRVGALLERGILRFEIGAA